MSDSSQATSSRLRAITDSMQLPEHVTERAVELAGLQAGAERWRQFLDRLLLVVGIALIAAGIAAFFAWNWSSMGRFLKFSVIEAAMMVTVLLAWYKGLDTLSGKGSLFLAAFLTGILLAVYGQTYQTGADPYGLFLGWAVLVLAWAVIGRQAALWLLVWLLLNLSIILYWEQVLYPDQFNATDLARIFGPLFWLMSVFSDTSLALLVFVFNAVVLLGWEWASAAGVAWLAGRWGPRLIMLLILVVSVSSTLFVILSDMIRDRYVQEFSLPVSLFVLACIALIYYRRKCRDLFMQAVILLSAIMVITALFVRLMFGGLETFFIVALILIGQLTWATVWLRQVAHEWRQQA